MQIGILRARLSAAAPVDSGCDGANEKSPDGVARRGPSCCSARGRPSGGAQAKFGRFSATDKPRHYGEHSAALGDQSLRIQETED